MESANLSLLASWLRKHWPYEDARSHAEWIERDLNKIKAEIAEMVKDGNDPDLQAMERAGLIVDHHHFYNAGRIAGLRLALDILEGRA